MQVVSFQRFAQPQPRFLEPTIVERRKKGFPVTAEREPQFRILMTGRLCGRIHAVILLAWHMMLETASMTRWTSASVSFGDSGRLTVWRPSRIAFGHCSGFHP